MSIANAGRQNWNRMMAATIIGCTGLTSHAQPLDLPLSIWEPLFAVGAGLGYKDNVTLAHTATESSSFFESSVEAFAVRLPKDGRQYTLFLSAEDRRYFSSESVDKEQLVLAQAEAKQLFEDAEISLTAEYDYQDQIADVSVTETNLEAIRVRGHSLGGRLAVRLNFPAQYWAVLEIAPERQWFAEPLDHYFEFGPRIIVGREYGHGSDLSLRYEPGYRDYDTELQLTAEGEPVPGTHRSFNQQEIGLTWRHYWDRDRRWRSTTKLAFKINTDNGSGYFDYHRLGASEQIRFQTKRWHFSAEAAVSHYDYAVQTVSPTSAEERARTYLFISVRAERQLTKALKLVAAYEREQTWSNIELERYTADTVTGRVQWEF